MRTNIALWTSLPLLLFTAFLEGCGEGQAGAGGQEAAPMPVIQPLVKTVSTVNEYPAFLEGKTNVEIRPQVDGYIEKVYVEEGAYVKQGQPLFKINDQIYREMMQQAQGALQAAEAQRDKSRLDVERYAPLVEKKVIAEVQLKTAESAFRSSQASIAQAQALLENARTNLGYTLVKAPVDGYIGSIPYKAGALVGKGEALPLTVISEIREVYAYFSMSEYDFFSFLQARDGKTTEDKIRAIPEVELQLPDASIYAVKGKVQLMHGQFDKNVGAASMRAVFPNKEGLLRSGMTGTIRIPRQYTDAVLVPQQSTYDVQDKTFVFTVNKDNLAISKPITIQGKVGNYYLVKDGVAKGESLIFTGLDRLRDSVPVKPQLIAGDNLLKQIPLE